MSQPNILFIGPLFQACGWGQASRDFARAINTVSNLTIRNIYLSAQIENNVPQDIIDLQNARYSSYDIIIQMVLPNLYYYDGRFSQNVGMVMLETKLNTHNWLNKTKIMDKMFICSPHEKSWLEKKTTTPIFNIGAPLDISVTSKTYEPINEIFNNKDIFKFLFIGENVQRKGIMELVQAYFGEFSINDNVVLIIKTTANIGEDINKLKKSMRRFASETKYPEILLITERLSEQQIYSLHQHSDVFVMPSYGEAFNRPAATSLIFDKPIIATANTGMDYYLDESHSWKIDSTEDQVFYPQPPIMDLYTSSETYYRPNILSLRKCMREATTDIYQMKLDYLKKINIKKKFSYETIGQNIIKALNVKNN